MRLVGLIAVACATTFAGAAEPSRARVAPAMFSSDTDFPVQALVWEDLYAGTVTQGVRSATDLGPWGTLRLEYSYTKSGSDTSGARDMTIEWRKRLDGPWFGGLRL